MRTFGSIREKNALWLASGGQEKDLKLFENCVSTPVFSEVPDSATILEFFAPPELHLMIGTFNHFFKEMCKFYPDEMATWANQLKCVPEGRSADFNGNSSKKLLKNIAVLRQICKDKLLGDFIFYIDILGALNIVVESCFGSELLPDYEEKIFHMKELVDTNKVKYFPRLHILFEHVIQFLYYYEVGLAVFSEQATESVHHVWKELIKNYKCSPKSSNYADSMKRAVACFNVMNL